MGVKDRLKLLALYGQVAWILTGLVFLVMTSAFDRTPRGIQHDLRDE